MNTKHSLVKLVRSLSSDSSERRVILNASLALIRKRQKLVRFLVPFIHFCPNFDQPKLILWKNLILALSPRKDNIYRSDIILSALKLTTAYSNSLDLIEGKLTSGFSRGINYKTVLRKLSSNIPKRLFIFHHYDNRGFISKSWIESLLSIKKLGWEVIISTNMINSDISDQIKKYGILIAKRRNIGLCLGAYKDLILVLNSNNLISSNIESLILCNNSTLPVFAASHFISKIQGLVEKYEQITNPLLAGLTDSSERGAYHLQSYFLYANSACLKNITWQRFWLEFNPYQTKDGLIDQGEIGLSQSAISGGLTLKVLYPIIENLTLNESMSGELIKLGFSNPSNVNQTLFAWKNLLEQGCPLIKKQVIFDLEETIDDILPLTFIQNYISDDRKKMFLDDLSEIFISRNMLKQ